MFALAATAFSATLTNNKLAPVAIIIFVMASCWLVYSHVDRKHRLTL